MWEQGREPGHQVVALGIATALTAVFVDLVLTDRISVLFDVAFVLLCVLVALDVRPADFFTAGVLPPLLMVAVFTLLAVAEPGTIGHDDHGAVEALISGLSHHSEALVTGYVLCLVVLLVRANVAARRSGPGPLPRA